MLSVCVSSTQDALSVTSRLRDLLGTTATSDDAYQNDLIIAASNWAEVFVGYPLTVNVYSETLPSFNSPKLMVSRTPIRNVVSLTNGTDSGSWTTLSSTEFRVEDAKAGLIGRDLGFDQTIQYGWSLSPYEAPGTELRPWWVVYEAGFVAGGPTCNGSSNWGGATSTQGGLVAGARAADGNASTAPSLPAAIERAVLFKAREWYNGNEQYTAKRIGDLSYDLRAGEYYGTPAEELLKPYRRIV